ncbi:hypothetical protein [Undibacterium sp. Di24W]|uniref:hypothetical protein n=1 Tax=Undibacterium sp. Di24W TaxID=3413033 RepID=UPI003BF00BDC
MKTLFYRAWYWLAKTSHKAKNGAMFLGLFSMISSAFAGGDASEGSLFLLLLLMLGILIVPPLLLALIAPLFVPRKDQARYTVASESQKDTTTSGLIAKVFVFALLIWGFSLYAYYQFRTWHNAKQDKQGTEQSQTAAVADDLMWKNTPLRIAACRADLASLRNLVNQEQKYTELDLKIKVAKECAVGREQAKVLEILLDDPIYHSEDNLSGPLAISEAVFDSMDVQLLQVLLQKKTRLPKERLHELYLTTLIKNDTKTPEQKLLWLNALSQNGINLNYVSSSGSSLLRVAFETQAAPIIHYALDKKIDPYAGVIKTVNVIIEKRIESSGATTLEKTEQFSWSPLQSWTLRRFGYTWPKQKEQNRKIPVLSEQEVVAINRRLRELTPDESTLRLQTFQLRTDTPDGGASLFAYMLERGVRLDIADASGKGLLSAQIPYSDQLITVLAKLEDRQLQKLVCPLTQLGTPPVSLIDEAKKYHNQALITFLESRQLKRCSVQY